MTEEKIIHIWANYSGESFYAEDAKDNWLGDYDTPEEAFTAMKAKYPNATIYRAAGLHPPSYTK